jgi:hypothetical protein
MSAKVADDLHQEGLEDFYLHVISKDAAGLIEKHIHSSNYIETLDLFRGTTIGGLIGFTVSLLASIYAYNAQIFGQEISTLYYFIFILFVTLFGIWEGGLYGVASENQKIKPFLDEIEKGKYLVLVYAEKEQEDNIRNMMEREHPESKLVATDKHFINPFSKLNVK